MCNILLTDVFFYGISPCREGEDLGSAFSVPPLWLSGAREASKLELPPELSKPERCRAPGYWRKSRADSVSGRDAG